MKYKSKIELQTNYRRFEYWFGSYDVASESVIKSRIKNDNPP